MRLVCAILLCASAATAQTPSSSTRPMEVAELRALDTITGIVTDLTVPVGQQVRYERLEITVSACRASAEGDKPDAYGYLTVRDIRQEAPNFTGWMIASSPALSAMDHARYDVWVLRCTASSGEASSGNTDQSD
ncbi:MAG: DUF2155 domain-containing protein [Pseudomonadota bacterium]